jgi:D-alanyl-D-alanine-carboxypeptidase/D-alanyl-D-alanine-endopeptidase
MSPARRSSVALVAALAAQLGCSAPDTPQADGAVAADAGTPDADSALADDARSAPPDGAADADAGDRWAAVDALVAKAAAAQGNPGLALSIYDARDQRVFHRAYGDFASDRRVAIASASKLVAGLVIFAQIAEGTLSLDATTRDVLGWSGDNGTITLRHLLSFTSGLAPDNPCTLNPLITLASCVDTISQAATLASPGERFDYGSTHLAVAARMAEVASGKTWNTLFRGTLGDPLGLDAEVRFYTAPKQGRGEQNPLVAGGMRASMDEYAKLLALDFHRGSYGGLAIGNAALYEAQTREPYPDVTIGSSPIQRLGLPYRYGLTAWLECPTPAAGCSVISSPGAFGFTPWLDREHGYYAILGMELTDTNGGVVAFAVNLALALEPAILAALGG